MKKIFALMFFVVAISTAANAQNHELLPLERTDNYLIDSTTNSILFDSIKQISWSYSYFSSPYDVSKEDITVFPDSVTYGVTIYGIAISATHIYLSIDTTPGYIPIDTSRTDWREYTCLYKQIEDSMFLVARAPYNVFEIASCILPPHILAYGEHYPADMFTDSRYVYAENMLAAPLYETYFDTAYYVTDTFWYGTTSYCNVVDSPNIVRRGLHLDAFRIVDMSITPHELLPVKNHVAANNIWVDNRYASWYIPLIFPILSPEPGRNVPVDTVLNYFDTTQTDTTHVDTTHNGISAQLLERYINVYPTVADGGEVTVLSSFHLEGVEVYDAAGRMLSRQPASGVATTVDVSQLPAGSYVLRINTVSGSTTKKFLKR